MTHGVPVAVVFDLGDTLLEYEGIPLNWEAHYSEALQALAASLLARELSPAQIAAGATVLRRYNTRLHPRTNEVNFATLLAELTAAWGEPAAPDAVAAARAFFGVFRRRTRAFPDALPCLRRLRAQNVRIGIFTDVPYGMPRPLVEEDIAVAGLTDAYDVLLTSGEVGWRKPAPQTLAAMAARLGCLVTDLVHVGNERKDVEAAMAVSGRAVLLDRKGARPAWGQTITLRTLDEWKFP